MKTRTDGQVAAKNRELSLCEREIALEERKQALAEKKFEAENKKGQGNIFPGGPQFQQVETWQL